MHEKSAFAQRLASLRRARQLTPEELADAIGQGKSTVYNWESDKNQPQLSSIAELAKALHCTADYLCGLSDEPDRLPVDRWLIDQRLYDDVQAGTITTVDPDASFGCPIPAGARIVDSGTYHRMLREIRAVLAAPKRKKPPR